MTVELDSETYELVPYRIMRLLGCQRAVFSQGPSGLTVQWANGSSARVLDASLASAQVLCKRWGFYALVLQTDQGERQFSGLREGEAQALFAWLRRIWYRQLAPSVSVTLTAVRDVLGGGYLRSSHWQRLQQQVHDCVACFGPWSPEADLSDAQYQQDFALLQRIAAWGDEELTAWRAQYVSRMKTEYAALFDRMESHPLSESQRDACIIDEDNNLVLAGAGTGKTSTMVGRAGFLLASGQARPGEMLMLAFARKAADEMQQRLDQCLEDSSVQAMTFHRLGMQIIAAVAGAKPALSPLANNEQLLLEQVGEWFEQQLLAPSYKRQLLDYFQDYLYPAVDAFNFETEGEYYEAIVANGIRTLKGEQVKSLELCRIANHLFQLGVEYRYQHPYQQTTGSAEYRHYKADFYLPDYAIYIEYFSIDGDGCTAPFIDETSYHDGIHWRRELHAQQQTPLIESYYYEQREGALLVSLEQQLIEAGVEVEPLPDEAVLATLREFGAVPDFARLLADLLKRYRGSHFDPEQLEQAIVRAERPAQLRMALDLVGPIIDAYRGHLALHGHIDFDDMIGKAIAYVQQGRFRPPWRYILVDEFQDISAPRASLIKALRDAVPDCSLFGVGDDWQAIYRFTGSDIGFTTEFERRFGATCLSSLDQTFRFNNSIGDIASRFVLANPGQIDKVLSTHDRVHCPAVSLLRAGRPGSRSGLDPRLNEVLDAIARTADAGSSVYLLARHGFSLPDSAVRRDWPLRYPQLAIECHTIHGSKGKEADYVVLLGLENGRHGFPSRKLTDPLLEALLPAAEPFAFAEERRLFYVALTRARQRVYLVADMAVASDFVVELLDHDYPLETTEFDTPLTQELSHLTGCRQCKSGILVGREGRFGRFYGCSNYPLCEHVERGCQVCAQPMQRAGRFNLCLAPNCTGWVPLCPDCGGEMTQREGSHGQFWGCRNYRRDDPASCKHTEDTIAYRAQPADLSEPPVIVAEDLVT